MSAKLPFRKRRKTSASIDSFRAIPFSEIRFCEILRKFPESKRTNVSSWSQKNEWVDFCKLYFEAQRPQKRYVKGAYDFFARNNTSIISKLFADHPVTRDSINSYEVEVEDKCEAESEIEDTVSMSKISHDISSTLTCAKVDLENRNDVVEMGDKVTSKNCHEFSLPTKRSSLVAVSDDIAEPINLSNKKENSSKPYSISFPNLTKMENSVLIINSENISALPQASMSATLSEAKTALSDVSASKSLETTEKSRISQSSLIHISDLSQNVGQNSDNKCTSNGNESSTLLDNENHCNNDDNQSDNGGNVVGLSSPSPISPSRGVEGSSSLLEKVVTEEENISTFSLEKKICIKLDEAKWKQLFSNKNTLPYKWSKPMESILAQVLPHCCLNFKRRKLYPSNSMYLAKFWFYCSIEGCSLNSTAQLSVDRNVVIINKNTSVAHRKGEKKSYRSRFVRGEDRLKLGESVSKLSYPSKEYHKLLANLDEKSFSTGNMKGVPLSKNVLRQCAHEYKKTTLEDKDVNESIIKLTQKYKKDLKSKSVNGFIQFFSITPLTIALWTEKDIELFHQMASKHSLVVDATGGVVTKLSAKEIFYFAFLSFDKVVKTEPVPHIEILTDLSTTGTLKFILTRFLEDEKQRFNYTAFSTPILCTTDFSWPIIKSLIDTFNNETLEEYLGRSYLIVTGKASVNDLSVIKRKTFVHISLCHSMKALTKKINTCLKKDQRNLIKYSISLLANSTMLSDALEILRHFFQLLLSEHSNVCLDSKSFLEEKAQTDLEAYRDLEATEIKHDSKDTLFDEKSDNKISDEQELPLKEDIYLRQSKRSIFFKISEKIFDQILTGQISDDENGERNAYHSPSFANYLLKNWCGILPLWTSFHLGDQVRHGNSAPYQDWSDNFAKYDCVVDPPRTQGIVELHNKCLKHITLNSHRERLDEVIKNLFVSKKSKHRQFQIMLSRKRPCSDASKVKDSLPKKISVEKWGKKKQKKQYEFPGHWQKNLKLSNLPDDLKRLSVIPWGGEYRHISGELIEFINTCTIDNFLQIIYMFYALNIEHMQHLFSSTGTEINHVREVVQLLLSESFNDAKFHWLTEICAFSPNVSSGKIDAWSTDKQLVYHNIRGIFRRCYSFSCSSFYCPGKENPNSDDFVCDMTLHPPTESEDINVILSISQWEKGTSKSALVSCKARFDEPPTHKEFISEKDKGVEIVRCSGWRKIHCIRFVEKPPFLVFEVSSLLSDTLHFLDLLPKEIKVYGEMYKLGGITVYSDIRKHYTAYIPYNDEFYLYDGLPSINPIFRQYRLNAVKGSISLVIYIPLNEIVSSVPELKTSKKLPSVDINSKLHDNCKKSFPVEQFINKHSVLNSSDDVQHKQPKSLHDEPDTLSLPPSNDDSLFHDEKSDFLLAKALANIDNENIYKKHIGVSYRRNRKEVQSDCDTKNLIDISTKKSAASNFSPCIDDKVAKKNCNVFPSLDKQTSSSDSSDSSSENEDDPEINIALIEFILQKKEFIRSIVSDKSSSIHDRSERLKALTRYKSLKKFEENASRESSIICSAMKKHIGSSGLLPIEPYVSQIFQKVLTEWRKPDPNDITDFGGKFLIPICIRKLGNIFKTIEYIIFPEVLTEFVMSLEELSYDDASKYIHRNNSYEDTASNFIEWSSFSN